MIYGFSLLKINLKKCLELNSLNYSNTLFYCIKLKNMKKIVFILQALLFALITHAQELKFNTFTIPSGHVELGQGIDQWEKVFYYFDNSKAEAKIYLVRYDDEDNTFQEAEVITIPVAKIKPLGPVFTALKESDGSRVQWTDAKENDFIVECEADKEATALECDNASDLDVIITSHEKAEWLKNELNSKFKK